MIVPGAQVLRDADLLQELNRRYPTCLFVGVASDLVVHRYIVGNPALLLGHIELLKISFQETVVEEAREYLNGSEE